MIDQAVQTQAPVYFGSSQKIKQRHLERLAVVYVRQSSPHQVRENSESRERQYALRGHAERLGWQEDRVLVIDEDQGISGQSSSNRPGFRRLLAEVSMDHVGLVLALELSRLSRSSKDWHHLVEVCGVFDALLGDQDGLYNASDSNDRLLLGMKGAMSEFELTTMRNRLQRGRENKALRGELVLQVPIGYLKVATGEVVLEPNEQARGSVELVFEKFRQLGSAWRVFHYFLQHDVQLGFRSQRGPERGQLQWRDADARRIYRILKHPMYAGAYSYGLHCGVSTYPIPAEIPHLIQGQFPAYISWEEYVQNQEILNRNRSTPGTPGSPRNGKALLSGLVRCGRCGHSMRTGHGSRERAHYSCEYHRIKGASTDCTGLSARELDTLVEEKLLLALEPASLELSLRAEAQVEGERRKLHDQWLRRLEQARYDCERAQRQYESVEPENRLVARSLESRWENALRKEQDLKDQYDRFLHEMPRELTADEREQIQSVCRDIRSLWRSEEMSFADKKEILRCVIDRVDVSVQRGSEIVDVTIHWYGGFQSQHEISRTVGTYQQLRDYDQLVARIRQLHESGATIESIALRLNEEGFVPPRRLGRYSKQVLAPLLRQLGLKSEINQSKILEEDEWWVRDLAKRLQVRSRKVYYWIRQGWIHARQSPTRNHWIVWADSDEITRLSQLKKHSASWTGARAGDLITPKKRSSLR
ncbi:MAG: recombinase family protein [Aureliella sp.]